MAKMTLDALRKLREEQKEVIERRDTGDKSIHIIVGMGTPKRVTSKAKT